MIPYGDPATAEVRAFSGTVITGQTILSGAFVPIDKLSTQFDYQGGPIRISLNVPLNSPSNAAANSTCHPLIDGAAAKEPVDSTDIWDEGIVYTGQNFQEWTRTRVYDPSTFVPPLAVGKHTATVACATDLGSVQVGVLNSSANITVVTYKPAASSPTVRAYAVATTQTTTLPTTHAWTAISGLSASFVSNGGPVELGLSMPLVNGAVSCRPLVDGLPITAGEPDDWSQFWNEGVQGVSALSAWHMWNRVRMYRGVPSGTHSLSAECRTDQSLSAVVQMGIGTSVQSLFAIAYDR